MSIKPNSPAGHAGHERRAGHRHDDSREQLQIPDGLAELRFFPAPLPHQFRAKLPGQFQEDTETEDEEGKNNEELSCAHSQCSLQ
jgi:hypothetical protein